MDILYQLPFPDEVCSKIFMYACKSPHTGLGVVILKKIIGLSIYKKIKNKKGGIIVDHDGNVVKIKSFALSSVENKQLDFEIEHLKSLPNLTGIYLVSTGVTGTAWW